MLLPHLLGALMTNILSTIAGLRPVLVIIQCCRGQHCVVTLSNELRFARKAFRNDQNCFQIGLLEAILGQHCPHARPRS